MAQSSEHHFPNDAREAGLLPEPLIDYSICCLVSRPDLYRQMVDSFREKGFGADRCEFLFIDNTVQNRGDGYTGLNRLLSLARGRYVLLCHQDIIAQDSIDQLDNCLTVLTEIAPDWAVAGNAGFSRSRKRFVRLTDRYRFDFRSENLPGRVASLDENFLLVRSETAVRFSNDLSGFHLYGTDLILQAETAGYSAWVIDFHVEHLGVGAVDRSFIQCIDEFEKKYKHAFAPRSIRTPSTKVGVVKRDLETRFRRRKLKLALIGKQSLQFLRPLADWLEHLPADFREWRHGPNFSIDNTTYRIPAGSPYMARKALRRGDYEAPERRAVQKYLPTDCPVIELGGSYGIVSNTIRQRMGNDQPLIVVEAIPELTEICRANIRSNNRPTEIVSAALAYSGDTVSFLISDGVHTSKLSPSVPTTNEAEPGRTLQVPATTLAKLREAHNIVGSFALVCDIEGAEFDLLQNEAEILRDCRAIIMEIHPAAFMNRGQSVTAFIALLDNAGFEIVSRDESVIVALPKAT